MNPSLAVIFLTLFAGSGFGLMAVVAAVNDFHIDGGLSPLLTVIAAAFSLVLVTIGMIASTTHLANPKNAWRAFSRWRTSWLAREGVLAVLFYPLTIAYLGWVFFMNADRDTVALILGNSAAVVGLVTIFAQGMIYACLRTIRQWHTPLVPANFFVLGLALGTTLLATARVVTNGPDKSLIGMAIALLIAAAVMKAIYYFWIGKPSGTTLQTATGFSGTKVRLLDQGHTFGTFLTREFSNSITPLTAMRLKIVVYVVGFAIPAGVLTLALHEPIELFAIIAPLAAFFGIGVERYLFFIEAQHVINLYHGRAPAAMPKMGPAPKGHLKIQSTKVLVPSLDKH
ncbi:MAG TPA: DmsC/YnfH family molybdoenzyme membrane anchor subunit [Acidiferrobacter sp.]|nr:DmsC/YnfH family molybdoenzyme membrane anchor subunit [Acidiferrobacter sp.]